MNAVDTNVLLYSIDHLEPSKQAKATHLLFDLAHAPERTFLLWQVLAEAIQQMRRWQNQGRLSDFEFDHYLQEFRKLFPLLLPTEPVIDHALNLYRQFSLSHWDSMLLGACRAANITKLYTEDMGSPRTIDQIELVNPFL